MKLEIANVVVGHAPVSTTTVGSILRVSVRVTLYSRPSCGLCDEARAVILAERERTPFDLEEVDVESSDSLELEYGVRIPVVLIGGEERFQIAVDPQEFAAAVRSGGTPRPAAPLVGFVGEVRSEPALGLGDALALAPGVVLDLVRARCRPTLK